jgi:hypothetical protein
MPTRLIIDGSMSDGITYYETFPTEPTIAPDSDLDVRLPIDPADRLQPFTLLALLNRMLALPGEERQLLIVSHGTEEGLSIRLVQGTEFRASAEVLHMLRVIGGAVQRVAQINALTDASQRPAQWRQLVQGLRYFDGTAMYPSLPEQTEAVYRQMLEYFLNRTAGLPVSGQNPLPPTNPPLQSWEPTPLDGVGRANLDDLLAKGNRVRGRYERLEFRGCNLARSSRTMEAIRLYFGCQRIVAPNVVSFDGVLAVTVSTRFEQDFDRNVSEATRQAISGQQRRRPVRLNDADQVEVIPDAEAPRTRRFDVNAQRAGDEVFIRLWMTSVHPHRFMGWLRTVAATHAEAFVRSKVSTDLSHWAPENRGRLPLVGLWLIDDRNVPIAGPAVPIALPENGDPLAGLDAPPPPPPPAFALPRDPEYRQHLVSNQRSGP